MMANGNARVIDVKLCEIAKQLDDIVIPTPIGVSSKFELHFNDHAGAFMVIQATRNGEGELTGKQVVTTWDATTAGPVGQALVERVKRIMSDDYDAGLEAERLDRAAEAANQHALREAAGEFGEQLFHSMRRDLGKHTDKAFIKRALVPELQGV